MRFALIAALLLTSCTKDNTPTYTVQCESPYYSGKAFYASSDRDGIYIRTADGKRLEYPSSVKCEISH